jgi:hypothetical protein
MEAENVERPYDPSIYDDGIFYRLFDEAESVRWKMVDYPWSDIQKDTSPAFVAACREMLIGELTTFSATERFFADFGEDADFTQWLTVWLYEETKHPSALLKWLDHFGEKFDSRFMLQGRQSLPFMPARMGTLATNVISEMVAATLYATLSSQPACEPVLRQICRNISGDEARHAAGFYSYGKKRLARAEDPIKEKIDALRILYFWITPELNRRVGHPVNIVANKYKANPLLCEAIALEALHHAVDNTYKRAIRVFGTLLELDLRDAKDVSDQLSALQG